MTQTRAQRAAKHAYTPEEEDQGLPRQKRQRRESCYTSTEEPAGSGRNEIIDNTHHLASKRLHGRSQVFACPPAEDVLDNTTIDCLRSLSFPEQESRAQCISFRKDTCQWLLENDRYRKWLDKKSGFFWVRGQPGAGKSALMKFASISARHEQPSSIVLSFFIDDRGTMLQNSPLGIFRALLNGLLPSFPQCCSHITKLFMDHERQSGPYQEMNWAWEEEELRGIFTDALITITNDVPVIIFIDALNECGAYNGMALLTYFRELMGQIARTEGLLKICFSSRYYPIPSLMATSTVSVEEENSRDIGLVIYSNLVSKGVVSREQCRYVEKEIVSRCQGSFKWAVLVAATLADNFLSGKNWKEIVKEITS